MISAPSPALAQNTVTNVMSPIVSYQYPDDFGSEVLTNGGVISPFVSYQYLENFSSAALTNGGIMSPMVSYQYYEWPGNGILQLVNSPVASYWYGSGGAPPGVVSASLSGVVASPGSVPADGQSAATVTVTLVDGNGNPVAGKWVSVSAVEELSSGGVAALATVTQPASVTDDNGQATATVTATAAGTANISAQDATDGVGLEEQATVQFTAGLVAPNSVLSQAIAGLTAATTNLLGRSIADIAIDEGTVGDSFEAQASAEHREEGVNAISTAVGGLMDLSASGPVLEDVAKTLGLAAGGEMSSALLDAIAANSTALTTFGQGIATTNRTLARLTEQQGQGLLAGIPPVSAAMTTALTNDLGLRLQANQVLEQVLSSQDDRLDALLASSQVSTLSWLSPLLTEGDVIVDVVTSVATVDPLVGVAVNEGLNAGEGLLTQSLEQQALDNDQNCYNSALCSLWTCSAYSGVIYSNTASGFVGIAQGRVPNPVTGKILDAETELLGSQFSINSGAWQIGPVSTPAVATALSTVTSAYSTITLMNTSTHSAAFTICALYTYSDNLDGTPLSLPMVAFATTNLSAGESVQVQIDYSASKGQAVPAAGSVVVVYVLGWNEQGVFYVDFASTPVAGPSLIGTPLSSGIKGSPETPKPLDGGVTNSVIIENPIQTRVFQNCSNQTYEAQIWVVNPFVIPLEATVTQPLPSGITVLATDGTLGSSSIVWTNLMPSNSVAEMTFSFSVAATPGASTNLPPPTLVFTDLTQTNSVSLQAAAPGFNGLYPVAVSGTVPAGVSGMAVPMVLSVTNWTSTNQSRGIAVVLTDSGGVQVGNYALPFSVAGMGSTNLTLMLPGGLPPGSYSVIGSLSIGGGGGQVLSGTYVVPAAPLALGGSPAGGALANGFSLQLQGAAGFGYLIEASTNLVQWQPIYYLVMTNSPTCFTDYDAPYYSQRFYRAVTVGQVAVQAAPQLGGAALLPGGALQMTVYGTAGQSYTLQASTNLVDWVAVTNLGLPNGWAQFTDYGATNYSRRFYRAVAP